MKNGKTERFAFVAAMVAVLGCAPGVQAQSADAIIDKLVSKGVLTEQEAKELREETDKNFETAHQVKTGIPSWVTSLKIGGDIRGRVEGFYFDHPDPSNRMRYRYRMRAGVVAQMLDRLEAGFRLTSSEATGSFGGDPISGNTTLRDNASKKFVYIDLAYGRWNAVNNETFSDTITVGKMENPFVFSDMVFDGDYTPEGIGNQFTYTINDAHALKLNAGAFVLDEIGSSSKDPWFYGAQVRWDAAWSPAFGTSLGLAGLIVEQEENLRSGDVPDINVGNSRSPAGELLEKYRPVIADASATYTLDTFPLYPGKFPLRVLGEYMYNPAAENQNVGWMVGASLGKSGKKKTWALEYRYKYIESDAWFEEFVDSDFGAYRFLTPTTGGGFGGSRGYSAGTNLKGHVIRASYSPADALTLGVSFFRVENVDNHGIVDDGTGRLQVDAIWKF